MNLEKSNIKFEKIFTLNELVNFINFYKKNIDHKITNEEFDILYHLTAMKFQKIHHGKMFDESGAIRKNIPELSLKFLILAMEMNLLYEVKKCLLSKKSHVQCLVSIVSEILYKNSDELLRELPFKINVQIKKAGLYYSVVNNKEEIEPQIFGDFEKIQKRVFDKMGNFSTKEKSLDSLFEFIFNEFNNINEGINKKENCCGCGCKGYKKNNKDNCECKDNCDKKCHTEKEEKCENKDSCKESKEKCCDSKKCCENNCKYNEKCDDKKCDDKKCDDKKCCTKKDDKCENKQFCKDSKEDLKENESKKEDEAEIFTQKIGKIVSSLTDSFKEFDKDNNLDFFTKATKNLKEDDNFKKQIDNFEKIFKELLK